MRFSLLCVAILSVVGVAGTAAAAPAGYVTAVLAGSPDPDHKVPAFNVVAGSGVSTFSVAVPQAILDHGSSYTFCIALQNANVSANTDWSYKITQVISGTKKTVLTGRITTNAALSGNGLYAYCVNSAAIPDSPGPATLTGSVVYETTPTKTTVSLKVPVLLN